MPMPFYPVLCYSPGCRRPAAYKVAARWSDGFTAELKTYGLACEVCLNVWFRRACERQAACRVAPGETLERPGVYSMERGRELKRLPQLES
jgi:hypothetical protein